MSFKYDGTGIDMRGRIKPFPVGVYDLTVVDATEKVTRNGDPMASVKCEVAIGEHTGRLIWHNVTFMPKNKPGASMALQFLKAIEQPWEGVFEVNTESWKGKEFKAKVKIEKDLNGEDRNSIAYIVSKETLNEDGVPF